MKNVSELNALMLELLEDNIDLEKMVITSRGYEIINEISDYAVQTQIFKEQKDKGKIFDDSTAKQIFGYMLNRICNAPTVIHRNASVILIMPFFRAKLQEENNAYNEYPKNN